MANKSKWAKIDWCKWMLVYCALAFTALWLEVTIHHYSEYKEHPAMLIPMIFGPIAAIVTIFAFFSKDIRNFIWIIGLLSVIVGVAGTIFHAIPTFTEIYHGNLFKALISTPFPPLAPGAFAGNGILVIISWFARKSKEELN